MLRLALSAAAWQVCSWSGEIAQLEPEDDPVRLGVGLRGLVVPAD